MSKRTRNQPSRPAKVQAYASTNGTPPALVGRFGTGPVPGPLESLSVMDANAAERLMLTAREAAELRSEQARLAERLRAAGLSWHVVGWLVGTTGEAARQRWSES